MKIFDNLRKISENHPIVLGFVIALVISSGISLSYLTNDRIKMHIAGKQNEDLFSALPFIIEKSLNGLQSIFSDWNIFFSEPFHVGDSNFYYYVHHVLYLIIKNILTSYKFYIMIILAVSFFSMYALVYSFADRNKELSALIGAIFYALTPYLLLELVGHQYMMWSYALLPITYCFIYRALTDGGKRTYTCIAGVFIALSAFYPMIQYVYMNGIFLVLFSLLLCFKGASRTQLKLVLHRIIRVFIMFSIAFLLSAYFILPMLFLQSPYSIGFTFLRTLTYPTYSNTYVESTFLLNRGLRADIGLDYFSVYGALMMPFVLPIFLSSLLITIKRKGIYLIFFLLGILSIFFSMGSNAPPFLRLFEYAQVLPYFSSIRTPCRFITQAALSFSLIGGIALGEATSKLYRIRFSLGRAKGHNYKAKLLCVLTLSAVIVPYLFSAYSIAYSVAGPFETQPIPDTTSKVVQWLSEHDPNQDYRIIDLTRNLQVEGYHRSLARVEGDLVSRYYRSPSFARMLGLLNVKYIITEPDWGSPNFYWHSDINKVLSKSPDFYKVEIDNFAVYVNKLAQQRIYTSYGALVIGGPNALSLFYPLDEGTQTSKNNLVWMDETFKTGWNTAKVVNTPSYGFETNDSVADLWITTTQKWPEYAGYSYDFLNINPNTTKYVALRLRNEENTAASTSIHLFDDLNTRLEAISNVHFSNWTTIVIDLSAYTNRLIKRILIYTVEGFNVTNVKLHTHIDYVAFFNEMHQPSVFNGNWALFSADVLSDRNFLGQFGEFKAIVFHDSDVTDLAFLNIDSRFKMEVWKYMNKDWIIIEDHHGALPSAKSYQASVFGQLVFSERVIYTDTHTSLEIPFRIEDTNSYDIWIRALNDAQINWAGRNGTFPPKDNVISASVDGSTIGETNLGEVGGFMWIKINTMPLLLSKGEHSLILLINGKPIYLDMVAIVPEGLISDVIRYEATLINGLEHIYLLEFSNYFRGENAFREATIVPYMSDAWSGYLVLKPNSTITQRLFIAKSTQYVLGLRLLQRPYGGVLTLRIDGEELLKVLERGNNTWTWIKSNSVYIESGEHVIEVENDAGYNSIDMLYLIEKPLAYQLPSANAHIQYDGSQFNTWNGSLSLDEPMFTVFTESYYPEWIFQVHDGNHQSSVKSLPVFYFLNAYHINSTGNTQFTLYHETSQIRKVSYALSISTFIACCTVLFLERVQGFRRKRKKLYGPQ